MVNVNNLIAYFTSSAFIAGAIVYFIKRYIDSRTKKAEEKRKKREKDEAEYRVLEWQCENAQRELLLQIHRGIQKSDPIHEFYNGEYKAAYERYQKAIAEKEKFIQTVFRQNKF